MLVKAIVTIPPYADFIAEVAQHPLVAGFRLNTIMPVNEEIPALLERLACFGKPLWVDLKGRQLRVVGAAIPPFTEVLINHEIDVRTPVDAYLADGMEQVKISAVDKNRLILADGPHRLIGPGESINIPHSSLKVNGTLTPSDLSYLDAMRTVGLRNVMLSYTETADDIKEIKELLPGAILILKIESQKGLNFIRSLPTQSEHLMAARGDLYIEMRHPHQITRAVEEIITKDPQAIVASRIFDSLAEHPVPACSDIGDVAYLISLGYRTFLFGDVICLRHETIHEALNLLEALAAEF